MAAVPGAMSALSGASDKRKTKRCWVQCHRGSTLSTLDENRVEGPDTHCRDCSLIEQSSSLFNQLPRSRLGGPFGRHSALTRTARQMGTQTWYGVEGDDYNRGNHGVG